MSVGCLLLLLLLPLPCLGGDVRQTLFSKSDDDVTFDQCLINSMASRSKADCARRCSSDLNCQTFTFTKSSPTGTCRLHSHVMTSQSARSAASGAVAYTVETEEERCPCGWLKFSGSCYWQSTDRKTWDDAKTACEALGTTLAEVDSLAESDFLTSLGANGWLGGSDRETEGQFKWVGSNTSLSFYNWHESNPRNFQKDFDCIWAGGPNFNYQWTDGPCYHLTLYLCEKRL